MSEVTTHQPVVGYAKIRLGFFDSLAAWSGSPFLQGAFAVGLLGIGVVAEAHPHPNLLQGAFDA